VNGCLASGTLPRFGVTVSRRMRGRGMMGGGMMGGGMMGPPVMMRMIFSLMDADGDGTISL